MTLTDPITRLAANAAGLLRRGGMLASALAIVAMTGFGGAAPASAADDDAGCPQLLRHTFNRLQGGQPQSLCQFKGKVLLIVNTATYCGYTYQYEGLEALYRQ